MRILVVAKTYGEACSWVLKHYPLAAFHRSSGQATSGETSILAIEARSRDERVLGAEFDKLVLVGDVVDENKQYSVRVRP